jgi:hypothetical protein
MYDNVPARFPRICVSEVEHRLPGLDQSRPRQSLHSHVRYVDDGKQWAESQKGRLEQELDLAFILYKPGKW